MVSKRIGAALLLAFLLAAPARPAVAPQVQLTLAAGPAGTGFVAIGTALAQFLSQAPGISVTVDVTASPIESSMRIGAGRAALGLVGGVVALDALEGTDAFSGRPIPLRTIIPILNIYGHLVTIEDTGINTIADLRGKRVSIAPTGSPDQRDARRFLRAAGLDADRDIQKVELPFAAAAAALAERRIDALYSAYLAPVTLPAPPVLDLAMSPGMRVKILPLDSLLPALRKEYGNRYIRLVIRKEFYPGLTADVPTVGGPLLLVAGESMNEDVAYRITKFVYEHRNELAKTSSFAQYISLLGLTSSPPLPYHRGAIRYYRERGVQGL